MLLSEAPPPSWGLHPGGQESQGSTHGSLVWFVRDSQRVLLPGGSGLVSDGHHRGTMNPHVLMKSWPIEEALGVATSTNKKEVEVFPHMAESSVRVLIDSSTVWTKGQLPAPSTNSKRLPHKAPMPVEVRQQELLICAHMALQRYYGC